MLVGFGCVSGFVVLGVCTVFFFFDHLRKAFDCALAGED